MEEGELSGADLLRALPPADTSAVEGLDGLGYLNYLRKEAGLPALAKSELLERSARNHARYLTDYPDEGHDEKHTASPLFSGETPSDRAASVGYPYGGVRENVSTGRIQRGASSGGDTVRQQADGLMAAVYHRFSLLEQGIDEAGAAYEEQNGNQALVVNQGNSLYRKLCASGRLNAEPPCQRACFFRRAVGDGNACRTFIQQRGEHAAYRPARAQQQDMLPLWRNALPHHIADQTRRRCCHRETCRRPKG